MKDPDRNTVSQLDALPNIGKAIMADLQLLGINHPKELIGEDAFILYNKLSTLTGQKHDPCVIDVFLSVIDFMEGGESKPWWAFTEQRRNEYESIIKRTFS